MTVRRKRISNIQYKISLADLQSSLSPYLKLNELDYARFMKAVKISTEHPLITLEKLKLVNPHKVNGTYTADDYGKLLAQHFNTEYIHLDPMKIDHSVIGSLIHKAYLSRLQILPISATKKEVVFAICDPFNIEWINEVKSTLKREIKTVLAHPIKLKAVLSELSVLQTALKGIGEDFSQEKRDLLKQGKIKELDRLIEKQKLKQAGSMDDGVVQVVEWLINFAKSERASDIHFEPKKGLAQIRFRVDGTLRMVYRLDPESLSSVIARLKILASLKLDEKRKPQDGQLKYQLTSGEKVEMRLSTVPCQFGEKLVIRIFDQEAAGDDLSFIGFSHEDEKMWDELIRLNHGMILVTGPTGSGKTTTLYTSLNTIATSEVNVCTVEDPIEMTEDSFNQIQVNPQIGLTFSSCIRAFLRQDPDIIMVGEIRDSETGMTAVQASLTGHLVFSSLHTNGALPTIQRLLDLGLPLYLLNSSLKGILAQRLVKKLCEDCKEEYTPSDEEWEALCGDEDVLKPISICKPVGCANCKDTGFIGRFAVYELVKMTDSIRSVLHSEIEVDELKQKTKGMFRTMRANAITKIISGETSIEEVLKVIF